MDNLIIFIPCYNEEKTLPITISSIPKKIHGFNKIKIVVVDDCSSDNTLSIAKELGVDNILSHDKHIGLAQIFNSIVHYFKRQNNFNYMIILDADNQYSASDIELLANKIISDNCEVVIGQRNIFKNKNMSIFKKIFQIVGSILVSLLVKNNINDVTSGFRIYSKKCFDNYLKVSNLFSYTIETIIFFHWEKIKISKVDISVNEKVLRPSRLFSSNFNYIFQQSNVILDSFVKFFPLRFFGLISLIFLLPGLILFLRFLYYYFTLSISGHIQSLILSSSLLLISLIFFSLGIIMSSVSKIRILIEKEKDLTCSYTES